MSESWDPSTQRKMINTRHNLRISADSWNEQKVSEEDRAYHIDHEEMLIYRELIKYYFNDIYGRCDE